MSVYTSYTAMPGEPSVELAVSSEKVVSTLFNPTIVQTSGRYNGGATDPQFSAAMDCGDGGVIAFTIVSGQVDVLLANTTVRTVRYVASPVVLSVVCEAGSVLAFYNVGAEDCVYAWAPAATPAPPTPAPPPATPAPIPLPPPPVPSPPHEGVVVQTEVVLGVLNTSLYDIHNTIPVDLLTPFQLTSDAYPSTHTPYLQPDVCDNRTHGVPLRDARALGLCPQHPQHHTRPTHPLLAAGPAGIHLHERTPFWHFRSNPLLRPRSLLSDPMHREHGCPLSSHLWVCLRHRDQRDHRSCEQHCGKEREIYDTLCAGQWHCHHSDTALRLCVGRAR